MLVKHSVYAQTDTNKHHKSLIVFPVIARSIETDWSFGLAGSATIKLFKTDTTARTSNMQVVGIYSLKKQLVAAINGSQYFKHEKYVLNEQFSYSSFPDKFWGIGKNTEDSALEQYKFNQYYIYLHLLRKIKNNWFAGLIFEHQNLFEIDYTTNGLFDKENIVGRNGYKVLGFGLSATYDNRNSTFCPSQGNYLQLYFDNFNSIYGSSYSFTTWVVDARKFIALKHNQVLALQAYSYMNTGNEIPFRNLASLGGSSSMRGYYGGRFRDDNLWTLQSEYRYSFTKRLGAVGFASMGNVYHNRYDVDFLNTKIAYGAGIRFSINKKDKLNLRLDYGFTKEGNNGLYFQLGEAF